MTATRNGGTGGTPEGGAQGAESSAGKSELFALYLMNALIVLMVGVSLFVIDPIKYRIIAAVASGEGLRAAATGALADMTGRLAPFAAAIVAVLSALLVLEVRRASVSRAVLRVSPVHFLTLAGVILFWFTHAYLIPGHLLAGDSSAHITQLAHFGRGLQEGEVLFWDNYFYMGNPFLQFYAPVFYWLGGGLYALTDSVDVAAKTLLFLTHALSGVFFYAFLRAAGIRRVAALVGAMGYAGAWAHGHLVFYKGALPQAVTMMFIPAAFLFAERLIQQRRLFGLDWVGLAVVSGALIATHQPHGLFAGIYLGAYVLARLPGEQRALPRLMAIASAGLAGVSMSLFTVAPFLAEQTWVMASPGNSFFEFRLPTMEYLGQLLVWSNTETTRGPESAAYVGMTIFGLACVGVFFLARDRRLDRFWLWSAIILVCAIVSLFWRGSLVRDIMYTLFFLSALAAAGAQQLFDRFPANARLPLLVLLVVFLDLGPAAVQPVARSDKAYLDAAGVYLAAANPAQRVMITNTRAANGEGGKLQTDVGPGGGPIHYFPVQTVGGPHNHAATLVHNYALAMLMMAERDLRLEGSLTARSEALLGMLNVGRIVNDTGRSMGLPQGYAASVEEPPLGRVMKIPAATPAVFAPGLTQIVPPTEVERPLLWREDLVNPSTRARMTFEFVERVYGSMGYRPELRIADRIPVRELPGQTLRKRSPEVQTANATKPLIAIGQYAVTDNQVTLTVTSASSGYLQLSHPWYPMLDVLHNGERIEPRRGTFDLLVVPVDAGDNVYRIVARRSSLRKIFGTLGAGVFMLTVLIPLLTARSRRQEHSSLA